MTNGLAPVVRRPREGANRTAVTRNQCVASATSVAVHRLHLRAFKAPEAFVDAYHFVPQAEYDLALQRGEENDRRIYTAAADASHLMVERGGGFLGTHHSTVPSHKQLSVASDDEDDAHH